MAKNLDQILTSYTAIGVVVDHPDEPKSGDPCRWGKMVGVALVDEQFGYQAGGPRELSGFLVNTPYDPINARNYDNGETPVSFQQNVWRLLVHANGANAGPGDKVYYHDTAKTVGSVSTNLSTDSSGYNGFAGVIARESVTSDTIGRVPLMLLPTSQD